VRPPSKRFVPSRWSERLVPAVLVMLLVLLVITLLIVVLSLLGVTPAALFAGG